MDAIPQLPEVPAPMPQSPTPAIWWKQKPLMITCAIIIVVLVLGALALLIYQATQNSRASTPSQQNTQNSTAACTYNGSEYANGTNFGATDGCNTCSCANGVVACTEMACVDENATTEFEGDTVSATVPEGWSVVEHYDGQGTNMLVDGTVYTGLTGIEIKNPANEVVFSMGAVDGIGGVDACSEVVQFADTTNAYITEQQNMAVEVGFDPITITDLSASSYSEFNLFDKPTRRVGTELYFDTEPTNAAVFNAACGIAAGFSQMSTIGFTIDNAGMASTSHTYTWDIDNGATVAELTALDDILASLAVI